MHVGFENENHRRECVKNAEYGFFDVVFFQSRRQIYPIRLCHSHFTKSKLLCLKHNNHHGGNGCTKWNLVNAFNELCLRLFDHLLYGMCFNLFKKKENPTPCMRL